MDFYLLGTGDNMLPARSSRTGSHHAQVHHHGQAPYANHLVAISQHEAVGLPPSKKLRVFENVQQHKQNVIFVQLLL